MLRPLFKRRLIFLASLFLLGMAILFFIAWWGRLPANTGKSSTLSNRCDYQRPSKNSGNRYATG